MRDQPGSGKPPDLPRLRVLVIDDDELLLALFGRLLRGHTPTLSSSGEDALVHLRAGEKFDAILCDLQMPGLRGEALFDIVKVTWPEMTTRMIFMSGGGGSERDEAFLEGHPALMKPFRRRDLERMLSLVVANNPIANSAPTDAEPPPPSWSSRGA